MLRAGDLDRPIVIERAVDGGTTDYGEPIIAWEQRAAVRAKVVEQSGREFLSAAQIVSTRRATFTIRWRTDLLPTDRIQWDGATWNIVGRREIGRREALELMAEEVK